MTAALSVLLASGVLPGTIYVDSEFRFDVLPGVHGACGPTSLDMAESYGLQSYIGMPVMTRRMINDGLADSNGVTTPGKINTQAIRDGFKTSGVVAGGSQAWIIARLREGVPVITEPSNGQALKDLITGQGMDATGLRNHFNVAVGYWAGGFNAKANKNLPEGFWYADPDSGATNPIVNGVRQRAINWRNLQFYSAANLAQSAVIYMLAVYPKVQIAPALPPMPAEYAAFLADPEIKQNGWRYGTYQNEPALIAWDGTPVYRGFGLWVATHPQYFKGEWADNLPNAPEMFRSQVEAWNAVHGEGSTQTFRRLRLVWSKSENRIYAMWVGSALDALEKKTGVAA